MTNKQLYTTLIVVSLVAVFCTYIAYSNQQTQSQQIEKEHSFVDYVALEKKAANEKLYLKNKEIRNNWDTYIYFDKSYTSDVLGGISNGIVKITNNTPYKIDAIDLRVDYIKYDGDLYDNTFLTLQNILPNNSKSIDVPYSSRGRTIEVEITSIYSDKLNFHYKLPVISNSDDPFFTKH